MKVSIILPTYNRKKLLKKCIESLISQNYPKEDFEIIVIDDGSTDGTEQITRKLKRKIPNLIYYKTKHNGQANARNFGLRKAKGSFIAFTDDDCVVEKNWLRKIEDTFKRT